MTTDYNLIPIHVHLMRVITCQLKDIFVMMRAWMAHLSFLKTAKMLAGFCSLPATDWWSNTFLDFVFYCVLCNNAPAIFVFFKIDGCTLLVGRQWLYIKSVTYCTSKSAEYQNHFKMTWQEWPSKVQGSIIWYIKSFTTTSTPYSGVKVCPITHLFRMVCSLKIVQYTKY